MFLEDIKKREGVDPREDPRAMARLRRVAEDTKIRLSKETRVRVREEFVATSQGRAIHLDLEVTRRKFEELIRSLLESTIVLAKKAVLDAGLTGQALSRICLVGGSTRIPLVRSLLDEAFRVPVHEEIDADLAVGLGASIQAAMLRGEKLDRVLVDVASHTLGIRVLGDEDEDDPYSEPDTFAPILRRNTVLPAVRTEEFYTASDQQEKLDVEVFQGEGARVSENSLVGSFVCDLEPRPFHSPVSVEFAYDLNGVVKATVSQPGCSTRKTVALSVADASRAAQAEDTALVEKKAVELLAAMPSSERGALEELLERFRRAQGSARTQAEEALLDFFVDYEGGEDGEEPPGAAEAPPPA
jgi:molecular chaperone DnaK